MASILALVLLIGGVSSTLAARPASAHVCTNPVEVEVGEFFSVNIGVASEGKPVTAVEITVPNGFDLEDQFGFLGWVGERRGDTVFFTGGVIEPYQCGYFTFKGTAPKKGIYVSDITVIANDGARRAYTNTNPYSAFPAMALYAGLPLPVADDVGGGSGSGSGDDGRPLWQVIAIGLAAGLLVVGIAWRVRR
ncbi:MAG: hypothetical protein Q8K63_01540 [Acidimicrobiales bacterium]|nr:hypothetical protein [Acidimicrobiales bacterium]